MTLRIALFFFERTLYFYPEKEVRRKINLYAYRLELWLLNCSNISMMNPCLFDNCLVRIFWCN